MNKGSKEEKSFRKNINQRQKCLSEKKTREKKEKEKEISLLINQLADLADFKIRNQEKEIEKREIDKKMKKKRGKGQRKLRVIIIFFSCMHNSYDP